MSSTQTLVNLSATATKAACLELIEEEMRSLESRLRDARDIRQRQAISAALTTLDRVWASIHNKIDG